MRMPSPLLLAAAAVLIPAAAHAQPQRKEGLWEMTMQMSSPMPMNMKTQQCTDASQEKAGAMFRNNNGPSGRSGVDCKAGVPLPAPGGGWSYSSVCTMKSMTMTTNGTARGDFKTGYHMESTTRMEPAPMPQMAETHMTIDAKWLGPCPADMKPGDIVMNGRKISTKPKG
jgi:hypothetical protein